MGAMLFGGIPDAERKASRPWGAPTNLNDLRGAALAAAASRC